jgi:hypothetical protein
MREDARMDGLEKERGNEKGVPRFCPAVRRVVMARNCAA